MITSLKYLQLFSNNSKRIFSTSSKLISPRITSTTFKNVPFLQYKNFIINKKWCSTVQQEQNISQEPNNSHQQTNNDTKITDDSKIPIGTIITFRQPTEEEKPNLPPGVEGILWRIRPDLSWEDVVSKQYPYRLSFGSDIGGLAKCQGCSKTLARRQPRIVTKAHFRAAAGGYRRFSASFCLNTGCVKKALEEKVHIVYPTFIGEVLIPPNLKYELKEEDINASEGCKFIKMP